MAEGLVSVVRDAAGGVSRLHIAFSPLDTVFALIAGIRQATSPAIDEALLLLRNLGSCAFPGTEGHRL